MPPPRSLAPRQVAAVSSTALSSTSSSGSASPSASPSASTQAAPSDGSMLPIILPIAIIVAVAGLLIFIAFRIKRRNAAQRAPRSSSAPSSSDAAPATVGAWTWLTGRTPSQRAAASAASNAQGSGASGTTEAQRRESRRERRARRLRRTDSGTSLKTIPAYREELADGELMLGKADDSTLNLTQVDSNESSGSMQERPTRWSTSSNARRETGVSHGHVTASADLVSSEPLLQRNGERSVSPEDVAREQGRSASRASRRTSLVGNVRASLRRTLGASRGGFSNEASEMNEMGASHRTTEQQQGEEEHNVSIRITHGTEIDGGGGGVTPETEDGGSPVSANVPLEEAPQYDSIYPSRISFSAPDAPAQRTADASAASTPAQRSALRSIFGRRTTATTTQSGRESADDLETGRSRPPSAGAAQHRRFGSSASVLTTSDLSLHPTVSRTSNAPSTRSRFGLGTFGMSSSSLVNSASAADAARPARQSISGPLEGSVIRTSMAGEQRPTPDQLRFLSSVESLGRFGQPIAGHEAAPPAWATLGIASPVEPGGDGIEVVSSPIVVTAPATAAAPLPLGVPRPPPLLLPTELQVRRQRGDTMDTPISPTASTTSPLAPIAAVLSSPTTLAAAEETNEETESVATEGTATPAPPTTTASASTTTTATSNERA